MFERLKARLSSPAAKSKVGPTVAHQPEGEREEWDRPMEFVLSLIGCSIGRSNAIVRKIFAERSFR